jgi:Tol biopolymer transport system component
MGVYSLRDKAWKLYGDFCFAGSAAFSPDGKRVAFEVTTRADNPNCNSLPGSEMLMILDLETGQFTPVPDTEPVMGNTQLSWSPDGRHLAVQFTKADTPHYLIVLIEIGSWVQNVIAEGTDPSWSPKGDWIAYHAQWNQTCMLIRPDGTGAKMVLDLRSRTSGRLLFKSGWLSYAATVWSPDEEKLLLHEEVMDGVNYNVTILDLATGNTTAKSEKGGHRLWLGA